MSLTTDNVAPSPVPNVWRIGNLTVAGVGIGVCLLAFCSIILAFGTFRLHLPPGALRTLRLRQRGVRQPGHDLRNP